MSISVASRKSKARNLQKWVAEKLSGLTAIPWGPEDEMEIQSRPMGQSGVDVILRGKAFRLLPLSIECKSTEKLGIETTVAQAKRNKKEGTEWVIVHKRKAFRKPIVIVDWDFFQSLLNDHLKTKSFD
jgi:hypothetical protein